MAYPRLASAIPSPSPAAPPLAARPRPTASVRSSCSPVVAPKAVARRSCWHTGATH